MLLNQFHRTYYLSFGLAKNTNGTANGPKQHPHPAPKTHIGLAFFSDLITDNNTENINHHQSVGHVALFQFLRKMIAGNGKALRKIEPYEPGLDESQNPDENIAPCCTRLLSAAI